MYKNKTGIAAVNRVILRLMMQQYQLVLCDIK